MSINKTRFFILIVPSLESMKVLLVYGLYLLMFKILKTNKYLRNKHTGSFLFASALIAVEIAANDAKNNFD